MNIETLATELESIAARIADVCGQVHGHYADTETLVGMSEEWDGIAPDEDDAEGYREDAESTLLDLRTEWGDFLDRLRDTVEEAEAINEMIDDLYREI